MIDKACEACNYRCKECDKKTHVCTECSDKNRGPTHLCPCKDGFYDDGYNSKCHECDVICKTCSKKGTCDSCEKHRA
jgi:hypothetical protein